MSYLQTRASNSIVGPDLKQCQIQFSSLGTTAYTIGDTINLGGLLKVLTCATRYAGQLARVRSVQFWELAVGSACIKPDLSIYVFDEDFPVPALNNPWKSHPTRPDSLLTKVSCVAADWIDHAPIAGTDNFASTIPLPFNHDVMSAAGVTSGLFVEGVIDSADTFVTGAIIGVKFNFER